MVDAAHDAGVHSLLPVLVVLVAELPGNKSRNKGASLKNFITLVLIYFLDVFESFLLIVFFVLLCLVFLGDQVLCGGESLF